MQGIRGLESPLLIKPAQEFCLTHLGFGYEGSKGSASCLVLSAHSLANGLQEISPDSIGEPLVLKPSINPTRANAQPEESEEALIAVLVEELAQEALIAHLVDELVKEARVNFTASKTTANGPPNIVPALSQTAKASDLSVYQVPITATRASSDVGPNLSSGGVISLQGFCRSVSGDAPMTLANLSAALARSNSSATLHPETPAPGAPNAQQ